NLTVDAVPTSIGISVTSSKTVESNLDIDLTVDSNLVHKYNQKKGSNYLVLPEGSYTLSANSAVIKAGGHISDAINLTIVSTDDFKEGAKYLIAISISTDDETLPILETSRVLYMEINRTIITPVATLTNNYFRVQN